MDSRCNSSYFEGDAILNWPDNWEELETEYNKNYDPYEDEGEEDDRSENDGNS